MNRYTLPSLIASLLLLTSCGQSDKDFDDTGTFEATEVTISAESTGTLKHFAIDEGTLVRQDSLVGEIDGTQLQLQKQQLKVQNEGLDASAGQLTASAEGLTANEQQLAATKAATESRILDLERQVASQRQQIANTRREQQRFAELVKDGAVASKQLDDISYQLAVQEKQLAATEEQLRSANKSLSRQAAAIEAQIGGIRAQQAGVASKQRGLDAERRGIGVQQSKLDDQLRHTLILAPLTGTVLEKYVEQCEFVATGKPLFKMADTQNMFLRAYITSSQLEKVKVGQAVKVFANYGGGQRKEYAGRVTWIAQKAEFTPKTIVTDDERADLVYAVKIAVKNDGLLKIGMYGEVKL